MGSTLVVVVVPPSLSVDHLSCLGGTSVRRTPVCVDIVDAAEAYAPLPVVLHWR